MTGSYYTFPISTMHLSVFSSHGLSADTFSAIFQTFSNVRRNPLQDHFSLKINVPFLITQHGGSDGEASAISATCTFLPRKGVFLPKYLRICIFCCTFAPKMVVYVPPNKVFLHINDKKLWQILN